MSFILDALKKSESDRQRQSGPALFEVKVAPPKARFPVWAIAIAALLVINMIIVGWMLLRRSSRAEETAAVNGPPAAVSTAPPANYGHPPNNGGYSGNTGNGSGGNAGNGPPPNQGASESRLPERDQTEPTLGGNGRDIAGGRDLGPGRDLNARDFNRNATAGNISNAGGNGNAGGPGRDFNRTANAGDNFNANGVTNSGRDANGNQDSGGGRGTGTDSDMGANPAAAADSSANPDDYAPAGDSNSSLFKGHVRRGTESGLMLYQDAALVQGANLPQLRLDLHVYAAKPQDRFALINMHKMHEGDSLQGGVRIEAITTDGVIMSHNGSKFLLPRE